MNTLLRSVCAAVLLPAAVQAAEFKIDGKTFTVPEGFVVELVARAPLVARPMLADFDEQGRLYVSDSSGTNDKVDKQLAEKPHRIVRLEDADGDGTFDKSVVFADKMMFPEGALFHRGSFYVGAPPSIWKLTDTDGNGVADKREEWVQAKTLTGCANDLHGPYAGPDGWIYWAKGAFAAQTWEQPGKPLFKTRAAHIFRARPDATGIEPVMTGGMDNPVEVAFSPSGERFFTTTFFQHPSGGQRDGLVHAIYGGVYGKIHDVIDEHPRTGEVMPVLTHLGPAAPSGLMRYDSSTFGADYRDNLFAALFNLHKVTRHKLVPKGGSYTTEDHDFLTCDDADFHPTDVLMDADGSVLVVDTGGWYKICCPTSQLAKPDVLGAIYRVRRAGAPRMEDPRGAKLNWATTDVSELVARLNDPRPAVRDRSIESLAKIGLQSVSILENVLTAKSTGGEHAVAQRNAIWALTRIDHADARKAVRLAFELNDDSVSHAAVHSASVWRDKGAAPALVSLLAHQSPALRRVAAEALGRIADASSIPAIFKALDPANGFDPKDRALEHSLTYALIEIGSADAVRPALSAGADSVKTAAMIALNEMPGNHLKPEDVLPHLVSTNRTLQQAARWVALRHQDWGDALASVFRQQIQRGLVNRSEWATIEEDIVGFYKNGAVQEMLGEIATNPNSTIEARALVLRVMGRSPLRQMPEAWLRGVLSALESREIELKRQAVLAARMFNDAKQDLTPLREALLALVRNQNLEAALRLETLTALPGGLQNVDQASFRFLLGRVGNDQPVDMRNSAVRALASAKLSEEQLIELARQLKDVGPMELVRLLDPFEHSTSEKVGRELLSSLKNASSITALRSDIVKARFAKYPEPVQEQATELARLLNKDAEQQRAQLETMLAEMKGGDVRRGQAIFNSPKAACASCHAIGYLGGKLGPDLTSISGIRTERDLLESIVFPSASFVRSYEPVVVETKTGEDYSGILKRDASDEVILATGPDNEVRIHRSDVKDMRPGSISTMPQGLDQQLTRQELADLLAFLKNTKWGAQ